MNPIYINVVGLFAGDPAAKAAPGGTVLLIAEPNNPFDPCAILVKDADGRKLGYVPRDMTHKIHEADGMVPCGVIEQVHYGKKGGGRPTQLTILVTFMDAGAEPFVTETHEVV